MDAACTKCAVNQNSLCPINKPEDCVIHALIAMEERDEHLQAIAPFTTELNNFPTICAN